MISTLVLIFLRPDYSLAAGMSVCGLRAPSVQELVIPDKVAQPVLAIPKHGLMP
jgi:hypothetical protein